MTAAAALGDRRLDDPAAAVLSVRDLTVSFPSEAGRVRAVRGVNFDIGAGEVLGIVGESGSGKSVSALAVMGLLPASATVSGSVRFRGTELLGRSDGELSRVRGRRIAMVFQDPLSALTPIFTVGDQVAEALRIHGAADKKAAAKRAVELLDLVGIPNAAQRARAFPHEFSGGMRQRAVIAMAIANDPDLIIADEPTTALDVTVQAQVLEVLRTAQEVTGAAIALITHDLGIVAGSADRVMVMYAGRAVETAPVDELFAHPRMPYTLGLLGSIPRLDARHKQPLVPIDGQPPSMVDLAPGCPFAPRCPLVVARCHAAEPELAPVVTASLAPSPAPEASSPERTALSSNPAGRECRSFAENSPSEAEFAAAHHTACWRAGEIARTDADAAQVFGVAELAVTARAPRAQRFEVLRVDDLTRHYPLRSGAVFRRTIGTVRAVDGVSFDIREGEVLGLVGESGCGKTTTLMEILELAAPMGGRVQVLGRDVAKLDRRARRTLRRDVQVVFQDPVASLDPRLPVGDVIGEPLLVHGFDRPAIRARVCELLGLVGLRPEHANRYPAEFSGGQRQRIGIARALALEPQLLVLDEPVSALDVSIQAGVINLLDDLKARLGLAYLFVAHDLSVVRHIADRVAVMYLGAIVEIGDVDTVFRAPEHPYTQALLSAIPIPDPQVERRRRRVLLRGDAGDIPPATPGDIPPATPGDIPPTTPGDIPPTTPGDIPPTTPPRGPLDAPSGCRFRSRCPLYPTLDETRQASCIETDPARTPGTGSDHEVACHHARVREVL